MDTYRVEWVNILNPSGKVRTARLEYDNAGTKSIEATLSDRYNLAGPGVVLVLSMVKEEQS